MTITKIYKGNVIINGDLQATNLKAVAYVDCLTNASGFRNKDTGGTMREILKIRNNNLCGLGSSALGGVTLFKTETRYWSWGGGGIVVLAGQEDFEATSDGIMSSHNTLNAKGFIVINLPHGAIVTSLYVTALTHTSGGQVQVILIRCGADHSQTNMASVTLSGGTGAGTDSTISNATINNLSYSYFLSVDADPYAAKTDTVIRYIRITYTVAAPLP